MMHHEREIDALLSQGDAGSIFDKLMALPRPAEQTQTGNEWDRAVASRFQTHLVNQMRQVIDSGGGQQQHAA